MRTEMGSEDDKEADVLIGKLVKWYRFNLIFMIALGLLLFFTDVVSNSYMFKPIIFLGVGVSLGLISWKKLLCPFCRKPVFLKPHESGSWILGTTTAFLPKKCPHCSRGFRVKKKKGVAIPQN